MTETLMLKLNQAIQDDMGVVDLELFGLPMRVINKLESSGIITLKELLYCTDKKLLSISQIGPKQIQSIKIAIHKIGEQK